ncbi:G/T mismatch-specific thymine DNA glycosylase-like isoform X1 [Hylaeus volcanicus]|uniref:G/T mismatch-specific thymine DNA glycosylase-like isoform X1 n=1 Tax=Hylaeus volcanicus TaxID=313075 RepID=UPI0023B8149A|nr:G/T mismatch-specific thymine DNA glycosylase-like isoform X1 [Hylaeus volcanicus]
MSLALSKLRKKAPTKRFDKSRQKINRFDGLTEEEIQKYTLPDYLENDLDIVFVGINPSLMAAYRGRYYAGPGNHFYKLLHESGLTPYYLSYDEDYKLLRYGIGLTNIVSRPTKSSADLKHTEIKEGCKIVEEKLKIYKPKIAVFNGKCIYEVFASKTVNFNFGLQPESIENIAFWVTPSSSARCANFPRMTDKLHFYTALKKYLRFLKGEIKEVDTKEFLFEGKCKQFIPRTSKMWRRKDVSVFLHGGKIANKHTVCLDTSDESIAITYSTEFIVEQKEGNKQNEVKNESDRQKTESLPNSKLYDSRTSIKVCLEDNLSREKEDSLQKEHSELVNGTKNDTDSFENSNLEKIVESKAAMAKKTITNNRKKKNIKRISQKPIRIKHNVEDNPDSVFVSLIKRRLETKAKNDSKDKQED